MALPRLYSISTGKSIQTAFGGLNESYACAEAEFTEMKNFSSRGYPALQTRTPRRTMRAMGRCNGMYHLNGLLLCEGTTLRYTEDSEDDVATAAATFDFLLSHQDAGDLPNPIEIDGVLARLDAKLSSISE